MNNLCLDNNRIQLISRDTFYGLGRLTFIDLQFNLCINEIFNGTDVATQLSNMKSEKKVCNFLEIPQMICEVREGKFIEREGKINETFKEREETLQKTISSISIDKNAAIIARDNIRLEKAKLDVIVDKLKKDVVKIQEEKTIITQERDELIKENESIKQEKFKVIDERDKSRQDSSKKDVTIRELENDLDECRKPKEDNQNELEPNMA